MTKRNYVTVNPCTMCQPIGSVLAIKGIEDSMVLLHGSQGCATYMRLHLAHHFREPVDIASSALSEGGAVYGGAENLKKGLHNVIGRYKPRVICVATTCLAETIGDDVTSIINEFREERVIGDDVEDTHIIPVSTPSYQDSHVSGYMKALDAVVRYFTRDTNPERDQNGRVNLIPAETLSPADIREIKQIMSDILGSYILLPDISDTFDAPLCNTLPKIAQGGTSTADIADMAKSTASIGLGICMTNMPVEYLYGTFRVPAYIIPMPIGLENTDCFFDMISLITGCEVPPKYGNERGRLMDTMVDVHKYLYGVRAAVYGDPDTVLGLVSLLLELGMHPVLAVSGSKSREFGKNVRKKINTECPECRTTVMDGVDFDTFNDIVRKVAPDIMIGNSNGKYISDAENIPLVRVGLPVHDRVGAQRLLTVGYRGAMELTDRITNTLLEAREIHGSPIKVSTE